MSPSEHLIALGRDNGQVDMWSLDDAGQSRLLDIQQSLHHEGISWIDFDRQGGRMVSTSLDGVAVVWDTATGKLATRPRTFVGRRLAATVFRPDSAVSLLSIDTSGSTWEWDLQRDAALLTTVSGANLGATVSASPQSGVLVPTPAGAKMFYDPSGPKAHEVPFVSGDSAKRAIAASADGARFVVVYENGRVELRDAVSGDMVLEFDRHVTSLAFERTFSLRSEVLIALDRGGTRVAYQGADQRIEVVNDDGTRLPPINLSFRRRNLQSIDISDDGSQLVISTNSGEAIWYDLAGIDAASIAPEDTGYDAQFVADGRVAVVGKNGAQIIDPRSRHTTNQFDFGTDAKRLAVDSTGRLLATVDEAGAVQLWSADLVTRIGDALQIRNVSSSVPIRFSTDGHYLLVSGQYEATWVDVWTADWLGVACSLVTDRLSSADLARYLGPNEKAAPCP
jgi:hypothetical protein